MMDENTARDRAPAPFRLGRRYDEVGPDLGRLYEAWNLETGRPALVLFPGERVEWRPEGAAQARLSFHAEPVCVTLELEHGPTPVPFTQLVDALVLMTTASQRVEDNPQVEAHAASGWTRPAHRCLKTRVAVASLTVLALGFWWLHGSLPEDRDPHVAVQQLPAEQDARDVIVLSDSAPTVLASYPLPAKPFRNQAVTPCETDKGAVEINKGCWVALEQKPPCLKNQAEHQGKCYLPVKKEDPLPQTVQP